MADRKVAGVAGNMRTLGYDTGEYLSKLAGTTGRTVFDQMRRSDPQIGAVLRAITLPIRQARFYVDPASDKSQDVEIAEVIEKNLLSGMTMTWDDTLRHALLSLPFGISVLEKVWDLRDGSVYLKKLDPRLPMSICDSSQWTFDKTTQRLISIKQRGADGTFYGLPIEKLLVFTCDKEGDNWEGISILRTAYKPWKIKDDLEKINVINHDRNGVGVPVAKMPQGVLPGSDEWTQTGQALEDLCANENAFLIVPYGAEVDILNGNGKATDTLASIKYYDEAIARAMLAQFISLGSTETGSRALGNSFLEVFLQSLQAYANYICEVINRFLIQEYVNYNWTVKEYPVLKVGQIKRLDPSVLTKLSGAGLLSPDLDLENIVRRELYLPEKAEDERVDEPKEEPKQQVQEQPDVEKQKEDAAMPDEVKASLALSTKPDDFPACDFRGMELRLDNTAVSFVRRILQIKEFQRAYIVDQLVAGQEMQNIRVPRKKEMYELLMEAYRDQEKAGAADVRQELLKQGIKLADKKIQTKKKPVKAEEQYSLYAKIQVEGATSKLLTTIALEEMNRLGDELDKDGLKKALDDVPISDKTWDAMINGAINSGWGDGRDEEAEKYLDEIDHCIYTSVLDTNTCYSCASKDGHVHELGDPAYLTPNPDCAGKDYCRCMTVYVMKAEKGGA